MFRIIGDSLHEGKITDSYRVKAVDFGNGQLEVSLSRVTVWAEVETLTLEALEAAKEAAARHSEENAEERRQRSIRAAARRAKTRIRHCVKAMGGNTMLTVTYRENITDLSRLKKDLKEFNRRVLRVWPGFRFVAGFEPQQRGAWHAHLAVPPVPAFLSKQKVKSYPLLLSIWRSVTKSAGGSVNIMRRKKRHGQSLAAVASYLSKYLSKSFADGEAWSNRWTKYGPCEIPAKLDLGVVAGLQQALETAYSLVSGEVRYARLSPWGDWMYIDSESESLGLNSNIHRVK